MENTIRETCPPHQLKPKQKQNKTNKTTPYPNQQENDIISSFFNASQRESRELETIFAHTEKETEKEQKEKAKQQIYYGKQPETRQDKRKEELFLAELKKP